MSDTRKMDVLRKRNAQMQEELDRLKEINRNCQNHAEEKKVSELIADLENIKREWLHALEALNGQRKEYAELIEEVRQMREAFAAV